MLAIKAMIRGILRGEIQMSVHHCNLKDPLTIKQIFLFKIYHIDEYLERAGHW
jgi:hypothetical protein